MFRQSFWFLLVVSVVYVVNAFENCENPLGTFKELTVSGCPNVKDDERCKLKRNTNVTMTMTFIPNGDIDELTADVHGIILGIPVKFDLPNSNACKDCGLSCPLTAGETYTYQATLPVLKKYPRVTVDVKWELKKNGTDVICIVIPAKLV